MGEWWAILVVTTIWRMWSGALMIMPTHHFFLFKKYFESRTKCDTMVGGAKENHSFCTRHTNWTYVALPFVMNSQYRNYGRFFFLHSPLRFSVGKVIVVKKRFLSFFLYFCLLGRRTDNEQNLLVATLFLFSGGKRSWKLNYKYYKSFRSYNRTPYILNQTLWIWVMTT